MLEAMKKDIDFDIKSVEIYEGKGCQDCRFTGYRGRTGIYEFIAITEKIRSMILERASSQQIKRQAMAEGMVTLRQDGLRKVLQGLTTLAEVVRVTQQEELPED
jgi:type II secretory ATPase GspE/PulE/Tfp pilus assembly ATPase PilB-like protein